MAVKKVSDRDFKAGVRDKGMTVVDFGAAWCAPCKTLLPILEKLDQELGGSVSILKLDADESPESASEFGVLSMPTVIFFKDGVPVEKWVGLRPLEVYKSVIAKYA